MKKTTDSQPTRDQTHRLVDMISDAYIAEANWLLQGFVAKTLNDKHKTQKTA